MREIPECGATKTASYLPSQIFVVSVSDVETLGGEGVGLDLNIGSRDLVDEAGLANVRKSCRRRSINISSWKETDLRRIQIE